MCSYNMQVLPPSSQSIRPARRFTIGDRVVQGSTTLLPSASDADPTPKQWLRRKQRMQDWVATKREQGEHVPATYGDIFTGRQAGVHRAIVSLG